jgi:hypothetical protein
MEARKAIRKISLFALPLVLLLVFIEYKLSKIPNTYTQKRIHLEKNLDSIQVLLLGGSQVLFGINPAYIAAKAFNLSDYDQPLYYDEQLALRYVPKMPQLKMVVISNTYYSFYYHLQHSPEPWRAFYYSRFWDIRPSYLSKWDTRNYSYLALYTPYVAMSYVLKFFKVNLAENMTGAGWIKNDTTNDAQNISDSLGKETVKVHNTIIDTSAYAKILTDLEELVSTLQARGIKVVFVTPPVLPTYYKYCDYYILKKNAETFNLLSQKYHSVHYDYFSDSRFIKSDFQDNQHLNFIGSEKFSKILNYDIIQPFFNKEKSGAE